MNNPLELLEHIDPTQLDYQEWLSVGMAIQHEGGSAYQWDQWSQGDGKRYKPGECFRKWDGFGGSSVPVTAGTLVELAKRNGWKPQREYRAFDWDDTIGGKDDLRVIDPGFVQDVEVAEPGDGWQPVQELITYLRTLFQSEEYVGYVMQSWQQEERWLPTKGNYGRTAGELIHELAESNDIGNVLGDYNPECGAWIRFNPLDGKGVADINITAYRYALIESDTVSVERQAAIYAELELPVAALVHSGKKSLHAIVRVDASDKAQYKERVNFLHEVCKKNGLPVDTQNKNPSRLSRMPGIVRNGHKQHLLATNQGKGTWEEWHNWIQEQNDSLPDIESLSDVFEALPPLAPPLIDGLLREGHKLLLAGPSKAGKSYILLQLAMAIAEGREWLGWQCAQGRVLYVNLELDRPSCLHRLKALYEAHDWTPAHVANIDIWNLRGLAVPMDALAPKLIRRALKKRYKAIIIDPIYKVITGDENAADKMAHFCNQFDRLCTELGSAVVYCHHHSKGSQGQKNSRDRSSGSGVFARDPDAILDLIELTLDDARRKTIQGREVCATVENALNWYVPNWREHIDPDTALVADAFVREAYKLVNGKADQLGVVIREAQGRAANMSGWRMEGTLREFPPFKPKLLFFRYPIHVADSNGLLTDATAEGEEAPWQAQRRDRAKATGEKRTSRKESLLNAYEIARGFDGDDVRLGDLAEQLGVAEKSLKRMLGETADLLLCKDGVIRTKAAAKRCDLLDAIEAARDLTGRVKVVDVARKLGASEKTVLRRVAEQPDLQAKAGDIVAMEGVGV